MSEISKGVVTRKNGNKCWIQYYEENDLLENSDYGLCIKNGNTLKIGDFVKITSHDLDGFCTYEKFRPTKKDKAKHNLLQKYLGTIAEECGTLFKDVLNDSKEAFVEEFKKSGKKNPMHIILKEEEINTLVNKYKDSIQTLGISACYGNGLFFIQYQLQKNYLFAENELDYKKLLGYDIFNFTNLKSPSCILPDYEEICRSYIDNCLEYSVYDTTSFPSKNLFSISRTEDTIDVENSYEEGYIIDIRKEYTAKKEKNNHTLKEYDDDAR